MHFGVLGPLTVDLGPNTTQMRSGMQQRLLAFLLAAGGRPISVSGIVVTLWPFDKPGNASKTVHIYVHRLRKLLGDPDRVTYGPGGYALAIEENEVDYLEFEHDLKRARRARETGADDEAMARYADALGLWRGEPYSDVDDRGVLRVEIERLNILKSDASFEYAELCVERGKHKAAIPELLELLATQPHHEGLYRLLMLAYYRSGHPTKALDTYRLARDRISGDLGIDLAGDMENLHRAILNRDPELEPSTFTSRTKPWQLPSGPASLFGRDCELEALLDAPTGRGSLSAIHGPVGVGKTALAVYAGHRMSDRYPDGQVFVDLHGFTPETAPRDPGEALGVALQSLGVAVADIPDATEARAAVWRSLLRDKTMLIVLDDAADARQVSPFLPGDGACHVIVTSRARMPELDCRLAVALDPVTDDAAARLFGQIAGPHRVGAERGESLPRVVELCAGMPLALRAAAVRFRDRPNWTLRDLVERLERPDRLAELDIGAQGIRERYAESARRLSVEERSRVRSLAREFRGRFDAVQVAGMWGLEVARAEHELERLVDAHFLHSDCPGWYQFRELMLAHIDAAWSGE
ncbi:MAG TPA: winged helix-turn-helix domain-containing protein [Candidatus Stackebrandtia faecavium]|nr:winged helix-turn-helix domain-containing protein [Candidatus Stackebrandtia faecavium]